MRRRTWPRPAWTSWCSSAGTWWAAPRSQARQGVISCIGHVVQRRSCLGSSFRARRTCCRCCARRSSRTCSSRCPPTPVAHRSLPQQHGLTWFLRDPNSFTPLRNGQHLLLGRNQESNRAEIAKFSVGLANVRPSVTAAAEEGRGGVWRLRALHRAHGCVAHVVVVHDSCAAAAAIEPLLDTAPVDLGAEGHYDKHFLGSRAMSLLLVWV